MIKKIKKFFHILGPGLTSGISDNDPTGIATYSQAGAKFGYNQLWTAVYLLPFLLAVQEACARIGEVNKKGLVAVIKKEYNKSILYFLITALFIANSINIGADIGAMAAAIRLLVSIPFVILTLVFSVLIVLLEVFVPYKKYVTFLKSLCILLLIYPMMLFIIEIPWGILLKKTFIPHIEFNFEFLFIITGVFGTTISPYMFFWQASQVVETEKEKDKECKKKHTKLDPIEKRMNHLRIDNFVGMVISEIGCWTIIVIAGTVLHSSGITDIKSSADVAKALEPLVQAFPHSGELATLFFAVGILGLGLLAIPVLAASSAYAFSEVFNWKNGLHCKAHEAPKFYMIIALGTFLGLGINFIGIDPVKALVYSSVLNGVVSVPMLFFIALVSGNKKIMGKFKSSYLSKFLIWTTFVAALLLSIAMFCSLFFQA